MENVEIRALKSSDDYSACVALQRETWGRDFADVVPPSLLLVSQKLGGVAAGAFAPDGRMLGFVFGMTGVENGAIVHWSDMLAVRPESQNLGIGRKLKDFQRRQMARIGARVIYWTYDPLVARNAHLNFNVFGVRAAEYVRDMYGSETGSVLHRGIGTDRMVVAWPVDDDELARRKRETGAARDMQQYRTAHVFGDAERPDYRGVASLGESDRIRVAVPLDVSVFQSADPERARRWRATTRAAFESAFAAGYGVDGFTIDAEQERGFYLLSRTPQP